MAQFTLDVPDELLSGLVAEISTLQDKVTPEEYFQASAVELLRQRCAVYKVGPYYVGPTPPQFNQDGTPYTPPQADEIAPAGDVVTEPDPQVNDTTGGGEA